jgi:hypothetical protein|tara:strand:- start:5592 stop:6161 length:570 start_codon:yes stop_codon:yes gene_type:complete
MASIATRGPNNILVLEPYGVMVDEVCDAVCHRENLNDICKRFKIKQEDVFECVTAYVDFRQSTIDADYIKMNITKLNAEELMVDTTAITDWAFLSVVDFQHDFTQKNVSDTETITNFAELYADGIEMLLLDCLLDIRSNDLHWVSVSEIHRLVLDSFEKAHMIIDETNVNETLMQLGYKVTPKTGDIIH